MARTIKVTGNGNIAVKPDLTLMTLYFSGNDKEYENTVRKAAEDVKEVKSVLVDAGIAKEVLKTAYFDISTDYQSYKDAKGNYKTRFVGYKYSQSLKFSFDTDNKMLGKVLYALSKLSICPRFDIDYTVKDEEEAKNLLLKDAVRDALNKASVIASASGVVLGDIVNIDYSIEKLDFRSHRFGYDSAIIGSASEKDYKIDIDVDPEDIHRRDSVTVVYEIK